MLPLMKVCDAEPPAVKYKSMESGTEIPICTVTVRVCGASTAVGADTTTVPVSRVSEDVFRAICTELPTIEGFSHETLAEAESVKVPSPALAAVAIWVGPFWPAALNSGPTAAFDNLRMGAATAAPQQTKPMRTLRKTLLIQASL
jgi:hypothetical protein